MNERKILSQIARSNNDFHPIIRDSKLDIDDKIRLQRILNDAFDGDFRLLIEDMLQYAIENEEYEMAVVIRDELNK
jgi:protein-arginine kinase activator protein McsA